jgi:5-methylcytosine-specific restriction enzyme A
LQVKKQNLAITIDATTISGKNTTISSRSGANPRGRFFRGRFLTSKQFSNGESNGSHSCYDPRRDDLQRFQCRWWPDAGRSGWSAAAAGLSGASNCRWAVAVTPDLWPAAAAARAASWWRRRWRTAAAGYLGWTMATTICGHRIPGATATPGAPDRVATGSSAHYATARRASNRLENDMDATDRLDRDRSAERRASDAIEVTSLDLARQPFHGVAWSFPMTPKQFYEAKRRELPWRAWYTTARWQRIRATQLRAHPMCVMCKGRGVDRPATVANHIVPHHGDASLFWYGKLSSVCKSCHDSDMQRIEGGGRARPAVGNDGWPIES